MEPIRSFFERLKNIPPCWLRRLLWALLACGAVGLALMRKPWDPEIQKLLESGKELERVHYEIIGTFWEGLVSLFLASLLLLTWKWWFVRLARGRDAISLGKIQPFRPGKVSWVILLGILVIATFIRAPMLNRTILRDEEDNLRRSYHGYHYTDFHTGKVKFSEATWHDVFFENKFANNPILFSVFAKASLEIWREFTGAPGDQFNNTALRMPALIAGLGSIVVIWLVLHLVGRPIGAAAVAFFAAVHPFHTEYSVEARGYSLVVLFAAGAFWFAILAVNEGKWRYWSGLSFCLFCVLYSYAGSIYFVASLGAVIACYLLYQSFRKPAESDDQPELTGKKVQANLVRFIVCGVVTLILYAQLIAPSLPQIAFDIENIFPRMKLDPGWFLNTYFQWTSGVEAVRQFNSLRDSWPDLFNYLIRTYIPQEPLDSLLIFGIIPLLVITGFISFWKKGGIFPWLAAVSAIALAIDITHHEVSGLYSFYWYWIYALPGFLILLGVGLESTGTAFARFFRSAPTYRPVAIGAVAALFLGIYLYDTNPKKPLRHPRGTSSAPEKAIFTRGSSNWVVYPNGYQLKLRKTEAIPETFTGR